ncbi:hypothetical protein BGZ70_000658 [Mortierella alpina]|uniref:Uncharacterized protein n=1 Tax=Mortierella alpina TaxID=64518 RepID=A0A9P6IXW0_MORAP|nr:hypothetical protein BGZ70_000658 [Mortierella alpina]
MSPSTPNVLLMALRGLVKPRFLVVIGTVSELCILGFHHRDLDTTFRQIPKRFERIGNKVLNGENFLQSEQKVKATTTRLDYAELIHQTGLSRRKELLEKLGELDYENAPPAWWQSFPASFSCPHGVQRVGPYGHGGKWVYLDDSPRVHLHKALLGHKDYQDDHRSWKTLQTLMSELGHTWVDIVTIDLAGGEHQWSEALLSSYLSPSEPLPFGQLQVRTALLESAEQNKEEQEHEEEQETKMQEQHHLQLFQKQSLSEFRTWFEALENAGLRSFRSEVDFSGVESGSCKGPYAVEYSFINIYGDHSLLRD